MDIENPLALHYLMHDDLFFLKEDRETLPPAVVVAPVIAKVEEPAPFIAAPALQELVYKGKKGGMLILVHYTSQEYIHETHLAALDNILKRKHTAIADTAILNMANNEADLALLMSYFNPKKILALGKASLPIAMEPPVINQPKQVNGIPVLYSFSFDEMMDSPDHKKAFWEQMKNF